ncbi:hypothetical protein J2Y69_003383 [Microbacterium resistens]|uniref:Uncharacterized protein n=1 Tax=Microbacterium resistens TaxID=156977 RepID=A0ABU1SGU1_9MICO|nr:hypothetical protein [Microbacterium resistens]MDR6868759.1 hypothetical protein [Microbacterium resistens]
MHTETALTLLIACAKRAPFAATGHGAANQRARGLVNGHMVEVSVRGEQVRVSIDGSSKLINRDYAYDVLTGAASLDEVPVEWFHAA